LASKTPPIRNDPDTEEKAAAIALDGPPVR
jgi:hypothetical protein